MSEPKRAEQGAPPEVVRLAHPTPEQLRRFLLGELSPQLRQAIVRHLLTRCPQCLQATREMWRLGPDAAFDLNRLLERTPVPPPVRPPVPAGARSRHRRRRSGRSAIERAFQALLIEMARELAAFHDRLQGALAALPKPKPAAEPQAVDVLLEMHNVIHNVLAECLKPAISDLLGAAYYPTKVPDEPE